MSGAALTTTPRRRDASRWGLSFVVVAVLHIAAALVLSRHAEIPPPVDAPAVLLDLAPPEPVVTPEPPPTSPAEESPPVDPAPPPEQPVQTLPPELAPEPEPPPPPEPTVELPPEPKPPARPQPLPRPRPVVPRAVTARPPTPHPAPPVAVAPPTTAAPPSTAAVSRQAVASATASWQGRLQAYLARFKRYPAEAQMRRQEGTPLLRFTMTHDGHVLASRIERGSGHESLDQEALDLLRRAQPLPPLPNEVTQSTIELVVPLRFQLR